MGSGNENKISQAAKSFFGRLIPSGNKGVATGSQRPLSNDWQFGADGDNLVARRYDLEIPINGGLVRSPDRLRSLLEMHQYCPEIKKAISIQRDDCFSSEHGDDQGVYVSDWVDREKKIPVDPAVKALLDEFIYQHFGAEACKPSLAETLRMGDSFSEIVFDKNFTKIERLLRLPVGEMFRVEDNKGSLMRFEQRRFQGEDLEYASAGYSGIAYHPMQIVHWRYQPVHIYGESLYEESLNDWEDLKVGEIDLAKACRDLGVIPVHHEMAPGSTKEDKDLYQGSHQKAKREYLITDLYTVPGVKINRISKTGANLDPLVNRVLMRRKRIAMSCRTPAYLLGIQEDSAKQLSGQPASAYARHIASVRQMFSEGLNYVLDLHLMLSGIPPDKCRYRLVYPEIVVNPFNQPAPSQPEENN
jgi:hypothetical protein